MNKFLTFTYQNFNSGLLSALSFIDVLLSFFWIAIVFIILYFYSRSKDNSIYRHYSSFFLFKIVTLLAFVLLYIYYYGGGDSTAFWGLSNALVELSLRDFSDFMTEMFSDSTSENYVNHFAVHGIKYPAWILKESEGYFVSKVGWAFSFISGRNFLLTSLYFALFSFFAQWRLYRLIRTHFITNPNSKFHLLFLYLPSVGFWCTGISKDTLVLIGILNVVYYLIKWFVLKERKIGNIIGIVVFSYILIQTREITFIVVLISFLITWLFTLVNNVEQAFTKGFLRILLALVGMSMVFLAFFFFNLNTWLDQYLGEAAIVQGDFIINETYTGKRYNLGITDFSITGLIFASPIAILTGIFRPGIWEALSPTLLLNGVESLILIYLFLKNIIFRFGSFSQLMFNRWVLLYAVVFVLFFAFITGLTSIIFGVLVRLRAPLLVFFALVIYWREFQEQPEMKNEKTLKTR